MDEVFPLSVLAFWHMCFDDAALYPLDKQLVHMGFSEHSKLSRWRPHKPARGAEYVRDVFYMQEIKGVWLIAIVICLVVVWLC